MKSAIAAPAILSIVLVSAAAAQTKPTFDCAKADHEIETLICQDDDLAALDRRLADVFAEAVAAIKGMADHAPAEKELRAMQRGWVGGRNECWKAEDKRQCAQESYERRIAELQVRYILAKASEPVFYECDGNPANEIVAQYIESDTPGVRVERGDTTYIAVLAPSGSGAHYVGDFGMEFWTKGNEAQFREPDPSAAELKCIDRGG